MKARTFLLIKRCSFERNLIIVLTRADMPVYQARTERQKRSAGIL
jgi:hypothetical protein